MARLREALTEEAICEPSRSPWQVIAYRDGAPVAWMLSPSGLAAQNFQEKSNGVK